MPYLEMSSINSVTHVVTVCYNSILHCCVKHRDVLKAQVTKYCVFFYFGLHKERTQYNSSKQLWIPIKMCCKSAHTGWCPVTLQDTTSILHISALFSLKIQLQRYPGQYCDISQVSVGLFLNLPKVTSTDEGNQHSGRQHLLQKYIKTKKKEQEKKKTGEKICLVTWGRKKQLKHFHFHLRQFKCWPC